MKSLSERLDALQHRLSHRWSPEVPYTRLGTTRLCIDGYPRSANSLLWRKFMLANGTPEYRHPHAVAHHSHDPDSVLLAVLMDIPVIMPVRHPKDCIASVLVYEPEDGMSMRVACGRYLRMVDVALGAGPKVLPARFDDILHNCNRVLLDANARFGLTLRTLPVEDAVAHEEMHQKVVQRAEAAHGDRWRDKIGLPTGSRAAQKAAMIGKLAEEPLFDECLSRYAELIGAPAAPPAQPPSATVAPDATPPARQRPNWVHRVADLTRRWRT